MVRPVQRWFRSSVLSLPAVVLALLLASGTMHGVGGGKAQAQGTWQPFDQDRRSAPSHRAGPRRSYDDSTRGLPASTAPVTIQREELAPIPVPEGAPVEPRRGWTPAERDVPPPRQGYAPPEPWAARSIPAPGPTEGPTWAARPSRASTLGGLSGVPADRLEDILASVVLPARSRVMAHLWPGIWHEVPSAGRGAALSPAFEAIRIETLRRAGALDDLKALLAQSPPPAAPVLGLIMLRGHLLVGNSEAGCAGASEVLRNRATLPASFRRDAVLAAGYCALASGNAEAGRLTADLIRGENLQAPFALAVLAGTGAGPKSPAIPDPLGIMDYRLGEVAGLTWPEAAVHRAEPAVLIIMARSERIDPSLGLAAAERAASLNLLSAAQLAEHYRRLAIPADDLAHPLASRLPGAARRAALFQAAEQARAPDQRARLMTGLLQEASQARVRHQVAQALAPTTAALRPSPDLAWFGEQAAEILIQGGHGPAAGPWLELRRDLEHWGVLAALGTDRGIPSHHAFAALESFAQAGRIAPRHLHRVITVLDALDIQIPIPLWEAASRSPQPTDGHLPATGVLAELKMASDQGQAAPVILRAAQALGPAAPAEVNLLVLGDIIRALKAVGLEREARALGVEALIPDFPRTGNRHAP